MTDRFLGLLGICRKAGKCTVGFSKTEESVKCGKTVAIFTASDISAKTEKELRYITQAKNIPVLKTCYDMQTLSNSIGVKAGVVGITDGGFAAALKDKYKGENQYDD